MNVVLKKTIKDFFLVLIGVLLTIMAVAIIALIALLPPALIISYFDWSGFDWNFTLMMSGVILVIWPGLPILFLVLYLNNLEEEEKKKIQKILQSEDLS